MTNFTSERTVQRPRTEKECYWCGEACLPKEPRVTSAGVWDYRYYRFFTAHFHPECKAARDRWESEDAWGGEAWPRGEMIRGTKTTKE